LARLLLLLAFVFSRGLAAPAAGTVRIYLTPASTTVAVGQVFSVDLMVAAGSQPVAAVDAFLDYDPTLLRVVSITPDGAALPTTLMQTFDNLTGKITYSSGAALGGASATGTFRLATIRLQLQALGTTATTQLAFSFLRPLRYTDIFYMGLSVLGSASNADIIAPALQIPLRAGWNLVSFPIVPGVPSLPGFLGSNVADYTSVSTYNCSDQADPWKQYTGSGGDFTAVTQKQGVWIQTSSAVTLSVSGVIPLTSNIMLCQGWNLIGYPAHAERNLTTALAAIAGMFDRVLTFDAVSGTWHSYDVNRPAYANSLTTLQPGRGYWIRMNQAATLNVDY
jgi:hypothetical protein